MKSLDYANGRIFDSRFAWDNIDRQKALQDTRVLDLLREACLIESYFPVYTAKMVALFWDDVAATSIFTIEAIEAYGHYFTLRRYLDRVGYRPVADEEVIALRQKDRESLHQDKVKELVNFMGTEHFAAEFFQDLAGLTVEPVLQAILPRFAAEEVTHSDFAFDLLQRMLDANPELRAEILVHASNFRHVGSYVMPEVRPAKDDNLRVIRTFDEKVGRLVGTRLSESLGDRKPGGTPR
jgi:hypothetical protein